MNVSQFIFAPDGTPCLMSFITTSISEPKRAELLCCMIASGASKIEQQIATLPHEEVLANLAAIHEEQKKNVGNGSFGESAGQRGDGEEGGSSGGEDRGDQKAPRPEIVL